MKKLNTFDIVMIAAFVIVTGIGCAFAYYYSEQLDDLVNNQIAAQQQIITKASSGGFLPTEQNIKTVDANVVLIHAQMDPIVSGKLVPTVSKLTAMTNESPTIWRDHLDSVVTGLKNDCRAHHVDIPDSSQFYFGFSRFLNTNPRDTQTGTLNKQLYAIQTISEIALNLNVIRIISVKRTYDEDQASGASNAVNSDKDFLPGFSQLSASNTYRAYPFEFEFECDAPTFRDFINKLSNSQDNIFVIRDIQTKSSKVDSYKTSELSNLAGPPPSPPQDTSPGAVAAAPVMTKGPTYLFGSETLYVRMRVDLIEWLGLDYTAPKPAGTHRGNR